MNIDTNFAKTIDLVHRAMDVSLLRRSVIANNIANAEVPNFKRSDVNFETELKRALESERNPPAIEMSQSDPRHIQNRQVIDYRNVQPRRVVDFDSASNNNGNNVDVDHELMAGLENQMLYSLLAQAANFEFNQVNLVLR
ncbi:MAG: flagellar basal body rod protein FlgB [Spirochaetaceae bacterium]|nr:flagellar basal body rod protein FlgB [Spirochaetaceae bacterium]